MNKPELLLFCEIFLRSLKTSIDRLKPSMNVVDRQIANDVLQIINNIFKKDLMKRTKEDNNELINLNIELRRKINQIDIKINTLLNYLGLDYDDGRSTLPKIIKKEKSNG